MDIEYLRDYILLAKNRSFTKTARIRGVTQPALSNHLKSMERELGVQLVERSAGLHAQFSLTPAGEFFLKSASKIVAEYDYASKCCENAGSPQVLSDRIVIQLGNLPYDPSIMNTRIAELRQLFPQVKVVQLARNNVDLLEQLRSGRCDCGVYTRTLGELPREIGGEFHAVALECTESLVWISKASPYAHKPALTAEDLATMTFALPSNGKEDAWMVSFTSIFDARGISPRVCVQFAESQEDFVQSISSDETILIGSDYVESCRVVNQDRVALPFDPPVVTTTWVLFRKDSLEIPHVKAFARILDMHRQG